MNWSPRTILITILMVGLAVVPMIADSIDVTWVLDHML